MKKKFLDWSSNLIKKNNTDYDDIKMEEIRYGLEGFYLTITKTFIIIPLSIITGNFMYTLILLFLFSFLRKTGFGLHATTSMRCLISSIIIFIGIPYLCRFIYIPLFVKLGLSLLAILSLYLYAPADTKKRPLINRQRCLKYKYITVIKACIISICSMIIPNEIISNIAIMSVCIEALMVNKYVYKLFHLSFDNYKEYLSNKQFA